LAKEITDLTKAVATASSKAKQIGSLIEIEETNKKQAAAAATLAQLDDDDKRL
jgi:hypothetical protein